MQIACWTLPEISGSLEKDNGTVLKIQHFANVKFWKIRSCKIHVDINSELLVRPLFQKRNLCHKIMWCDDFNALTSAHLYLLLQLAHSQMVVIRRLYLSVTPIFLPFSIAWPCLRLFQAWSGLWTKRSSRSSQSHPVFQVHDEKNFKGQSHDYEINLAFSYEIDTGRSWHGDRPQQFFEFIRGSSYFYHWFQFFPIVLSLRPIPVMLAACVWVLFCVKPAA